MSERFLIGGRYRILRPLGEGGMARVFKAEDVQATGRRLVALKLLRADCAEDPAALERFHREARTLQSLSHPNIVGILDHDDDGRFHYLVMEHVGGVSLQQLIWEQGPLPLSRALDLAIQIAAAVGAAHREGIVHCDIKPANILVTPDDQVKVADFGIARSLLGPPVTDGARGIVWGTAPYLAPEQVRGQPARFTTDVYSIGAVLYEMLTGSPPYQDKEPPPDPREILKRKLLDDPTPLRALNPRIPVQVARIVAGAMARDPAQRFRTARQFEQILIGYRDRGAVTTQPFHAPAIRKESRLYWATVAALGLVLLAAIPVGGLLFYRRYLDSSQAQPPVAMAAEPSPPAPGTPDPAANTMVPAPRLVGMGQEEARRTAAQSGLGFQVLAEEYREDVAPLTVLTQTVSAGEWISPGTSIGVVLSRGSEFVVVPAVAGQGAEEAGVRLEELAFKVETEERRSAEHAKGLVVEQSPKAGTVALRGSIVHLVVSSGRDRELDIQFADEIVLRSCELPEGPLGRGQPLRVTLWWEALKQVDQDYTVFVHLVYSDEFIAAQHDGQPGQGARPSTAWKVGERVQDSHLLMVPAGAAPGLYWVEVGLYHQPTMTRLKPLGSDDAEVTPDGAVRIGQVEVQL